MKLEKLSKGYFKKFIIILVIISIFGITFMNRSKAKYRVTQSIQIVNGEVNYRPADFSLISINLQTEEDSDNYTFSQNIPTTGYSLNETKTYCTILGTEYKGKAAYNGQGIIINYNGKTADFLGLNKANTRCYLYFDIQKGFSDLPDKIKKEVKGTVTTVTGPSCDAAKNGTCSDGDGKTNNMAENGVYSAPDDYGTSYVYRGTVDNNWVKFGQMKTGDDAGKDIWWRIIRINGNGTIRMIYAGLTDAGSKTAPATEGAGTQITTAYESDKTVQQYNASRDDNAYVGYRYGATNSGKYETTHTNENDSTIKTEIDTWYGTTNLSTLINKIDVETGFCNDRDLSPVAHGSYGILGYNKEQTVYAGYHRTHNDGTSYDTTQEPTLKCGTPNRDLFTGPNAQGDGKVKGNNALDKSPLGLITADEVLYAGGFGIQKNKKYWLYTNQYYWTMSPCYVDSRGVADVFNVDYTGSLSSADVNSTSPGVRPVINLKADTIFKTGGTGTSTNPYEVVI